MNHVIRDEMIKAQEEGKEFVSASGIEAALDATSLEEVDKHPEKRRKAVRYKIYILGIPRIS